jgi:hypothetical protein
MDSGTNSFIRAPDGSFSQLTNDDWGIMAHAINNAGVIAGDYELPGDTECAPHGFLLASGSYTSFDVPGGCSTTVSGLNDLGHVIVLSIVNGPRRTSSAVRMAAGTI